MLYSVSRVAHARPVAEQTPTKHSELAGAWEEFPDLVALYAAADYLEPAEADFLTRHAQEIPTWSLLDLGFGGGRTTAHIASKVREYHGLDIDPAMIAACAKKFPELAAGGALALGSADDLSRYADATFSAVWFSFNGLDYVPLNRVSAVLNEVFRVLRPGGVFFYSGHHLAAYPTLFEPNPAWSTPFRIKRALRNAVVRICNAPLMSSPVARICEPMYFTGPRRLLQLWREGRGRFTYALPEWHEQQLRAAHFTDVRVMTPGGAAWPNATEKPPLWLHYEARKP